MFDQFRPALAMLGLMTLLTGLAYPLAMTGIAQALFPHRANASLVERDGRIVGSALVGQSFEGAGYVHPRPSAVDFNAAASGASNLGPTNASLLEAYAARAEAFRAENGVTLVPMDAITASGSGLDPHVSLQNAQLQAARVAAARGVPTDRVLALVNAQAERGQFGLPGAPRVNVLLLNLSLDAELPPAATVPQAENG